LVDNKTFPKILLLSLKSGLQKIPGTGSVKKRILIGNTVYSE